jgi:MFS superfamily sulfate permease-like transporter
MKSNVMTLPADGFAGLKENFSSDILSGFIVSLLALPLSLGIASASDFPNPMYGVLGAVIGGIVVSMFAGSVLTIKGPAAGLIVICSGAVAAFGGGEVGWHMALGAIAVAALFQILFGLLKLGKLTDFFPLSAVHGMLAAIGIIIISKQLHILLGVNPVNHEGKAMVEPLELIGALPSTFAKFAANLPVAITGLTCLAIVVGIPLIKLSWLKKLPVPMIVLAVAIPLAMIFGLGDIKGALLRFDQPFLSLVHLNANTMGMHHMGTFIQYVVLFAIIGSLESLLTAKAIDLLDPFQRKSNFNKDLIAVGSGNLLSSLLGGLPIISEVARSSANVSNGGKTRWANFFHGVFLLIFMVFLLPVLQLIPKAALAAMLIGVGIKLAHPKEFLHAWHIGKEQFLVFVVTVICTLGVDLLVGIAAGILTEICINLFHGKPLNRSFRPSMEIEEISDDVYSVKINDAAVFSNFLGIKSQLNTIPAGKKVFVDLNNTKLVDHSAMENFHQFKKDYNRAGGEFVIAGLDDHIVKTSHEFAKRVKR